MTSKRRGNGEGSIFQRKDGRWVARITVGYDANGKRNQRTVYGKTKRECQEKLTRLQHQKLDGTLGEQTKLTVAQFLERWLNDSAKPTIRESTHENYESMIRLHINPHIGGVKLSKLTPSHVQGAYAAMEREGDSGRVRELSHTVLSRALKQAVKWGMIPRNVCDIVDKPKSTKKEIHPLSAEQARLFLTEAESDRLHALHVLAVTTGMRQGELMALHWENTNLEAGTVSVRHTLRCVKGKPILSPPKSAKGKRLIELPALAVTALWEHKRQMLAEGFASVPWVFCSTVGTPMHRTNLVRSSFRPILKRANLPKIRFHDLRHTAATLLLLEGVHPKVVQEMLGHATISQTMDTYSHVLPSMQKEAAGKIDRLFQLETA
jgi:integrase